MNGLCECGHRGYAHEYAAPHRCAVLGCTCLNWREATLEGTTPGVASQGAEYAALDAEARRLGMAVVSKDHLTASARAFDVLRDVRREATDILRPFEPSAPDLAIKNATLRIENEQLKDRGANMFLAERALKLETYLREVVLPEFQYIAQIQPETIPVHNDEFIRASWVQPRVDAAIQSIKEFLKAHEPMESIP